MDNIHGSGTGIYDAGDAETILQTISLSPPKQNASVGIDYARYEALLDDPSLSAEDKRSLIDALWSIVTAFVQMGFGVHPVQAALEARASRKRNAEDACTAGTCGKLKASQSGESHDLVDLKDKEDGS